MTVVCITGTRFGATPPQLRRLGLLLLLLKPSQLLHGACQGVDTEAAQIAATMNPRPRIIAFPGPKSGWENPYAVADEWMEPETHFARNRRMVNLSEVVVACPYDAVLSDKGGTAYTANIALKSRLPVYLVTPGGRCQLLRHGREMEDVPA